MLLKSLFALKYIIDEYFSFFYDSIYLFTASVFGTSATSGFSFGKSGGGFNFNTPTSGFSAPQAPVSYILYLQITVTLHSYAIQFQPYNFQVRENTEIKSTCLRVILIVQLYTNLVSLQSVQ